MQKRQITLLYSLTLLTLGIAIGSSVTLLLFKTKGTWPSPNDRQTQRSTHKPRLKTPVITKNEPSIGESNAPITIVEFSDFECPYSAVFSNKIMPNLKREYINPGLVKFVHKDLPLSFHSQAIRAASATRCTSTQNQYWELYDAIFSQQDCLNCKGVLSIAKEQRLDTKAMAKCMKRDSTLKIIATNTSEARLNDIRATPTFIIGPTRNDGKHDGTVIEGAVSWSTFKAAINQQIEKMK